MAPVPPFPSLPALVPTPPFLFLANHSTSLVNSRVPYGLESFLANRNATDGGDVAASSSSGRGGDEGEEDEESAGGGDSDTKSSTVAPASTPAPQPAPLPPVPPTAKSLSAFLARFLGFGSLSFACFPPDTYTFCQLLG